MATAFQIGAFQFTGFQEGLPGSGGWWPAYAARSREIARRKAKRQVEEAASLAALTAKAPPMPDYVFLPQTATLRSLSPRTLPAKDVELESFRAFMAMIADMDHD